LRTYAPFLFNGTDYGQRMDVFSGRHYLPHLGELAGYGTLISAYQRAALNAPTKRTTSGPDACWETDRVPRDESRSAQRPGLDRASTASEYGLSASLKATGCDQDAGRSRQDFARHRLVRAASAKRKAWPSAGPCSRAWRARSRVVHNSWGYPRSFAFRQASDTSHALASVVILGSLPGRGRSSSATIGP
jgi:hypothetical protein